MSHFLQQEGFGEPVGVKARFADVAAFRRFIKRGVELEDLIKYRCFIQAFEAKLTIHALAGILAFLVSTASAPRFVLRDVREALIGERLAQRLVHALRSKVACAG